MKTMYDLSREFGDGLIDLHKDFGFDVLCREMADRMARMKDEILVAWFAEHGFAPGKAVLVHDCTGGMVRHYIREHTAEEAERAKLVEPVPSASASTGSPKLPQIRGMCYGCINESNTGNTACNCCQRNPVFDDCYEVATKK